MSHYESEGCVLYFLKHNTVFQPGTIRQSLKGHQKITLYSVNTCVGKLAYISLDFSIKGSDFEI